MRPGIKRALIAGLALASSALPIAACADSGGSIVITRQVSPRIAYRDGAGPVTSSVSATAAVDGALGLDGNQGGTVTQVLSDSQFASINSGIPLPSGQSGPLVSIVGLDIPGALGVGPGGGDAPNSSATISATVGGSAVRATAGIGPQVAGSLGAALGALHR